MKKNLIFSLLVMTSLMLVVGGVSAVPSTYEITQTGLADSYGIETLVDTTGTQFEINSDVENAILGKTPIDVTLVTDVLGDSGYDFVRINPINAGANIQLWANDGSNWYDINVVGWGPISGFPLTQEYEETTQVYLISDAGDTYTLTVDLVDVDTSVVITTSSEEVYVDGEGPAISNPTVDPEYPTTSDNVEVCAIITDYSDITSVILDCSASSGASISQPMSLSGGEYCGDTSFVSLLASDGVVVDCTITAEDEYGNSGSELETSLWIFDGQAPTADANGPYSCNEGSLELLNASASWDTVDLILNYKWDLDDDGIYEVDTGTTPSVNYNCIDDGVYDVSVEVTDDAGFTNTADSTVTVINVNPVAIINGDSSADEGEQISLLGDFSDQGTADTISLWEWDLSYDGTFVQDSTEQNVDFECLQDGTYNVTLRVTDDDEGVSNIVTKVLTCNNVAPTINSMSISPNPINEEEETTLSASVSDTGDDTTLDYEINWGDNSENTVGSTTDGTISENHQYMDDDTDDKYTITLTVTDSDDAFATETDEIVVNNLAPWNVDAGEDKNSAIGDEVQFSGSATDVVADTLSYAWDFNEDGTIDSTEQNPTYTYDERGIYTVTLTVSDEDEGNSTNTLTISVYDYKINLDADWNLISIPLVPEDDETSINSVFGGEILENAEVIWSYTYDKTLGENVWKYNTPAEEGWNINPLRVQNIIPGYGYYIKMNNEVTVYNDGERMYGNSDNEDEWNVPKPPVVTLATNSWNLIGHYGIEDNEIDNALISLTNVDNNKYYDLISDGSNNALDILEKTKGYWLSIKLVPGADNIQYKAAYSVL